ncbi:MAG: hypothetical protein ACON35_00420 [Candidatus Marinamargulisbacteria bacterium]
MGKKKLIALIITLFLCVIIVGLSNKKNNSITSSSKILLKQQERIFDETRFVFKPVLESFKTKQELKILLEVTSYIHQDIIDFDFKSNTMLEVGDMVLLPDAFVVLEKSNHKLVGQYLFQPKEFQPNQNWAIRLFTYSDHEIIWN